MKFQLPNLPYDYNALEPYIDAKTMEIHHQKHHQTYIDKLNMALEKYPESQNYNLEQLLKNLNSIPLDIQQQIRNNGGGHFNHSFFWLLMTPIKNQPSSFLLEKINYFFKDFNNFKELFINTALNHFGSGWGWLAYNPQNQNLEIYSTLNQDNPLMENKIPLLGVDVWEHAYYLKYQNKRKDYLEAFFEIINWQQVEENFKINNLL